MKKLMIAAFAQLASSLLVGACSPAEEAGHDMPLAEAGTTSSSDTQSAMPRGGSPFEAGRPGSGAPGGDTIASDGGIVMALDAGAPRPADAGASRDGSSAPADGGRSDSASPSGSDSGTPAATCDLPSTFKWKGDGPLAQPKNGWLSMKDFSHVIHNGQHIVYFTTFQNNWGSGMMTFKEWSDAASAPQVATSFGVAPTLFYFTPKSVWVLAYQWGPHKFSYRTSSDPTNASSWSAEKSLYNTALPTGGTGPIDQTVICDSAKCYLYYAGDNGHIYKSSMPIASFPGEFPAGQDSGIVGTAQNLFEAVQVYKLAGSDKYLMIVEAQGSARYFRAWTATNLDGPWTLLTDDFAVKKNVTLSPDWSNDISHGDLVRTNADQTFTVDPCNLQFVFQGRDPTMNTEYGRLPYRLGLITLQR